MKAKKIILLSWIMQSAKQQLEELKANPEIDNGFIGDGDLQDYMKFLIDSHTEEWLVYNDYGDDRTL